MYVLGFSTWFWVFVRVQSADFALTSHNDDDARTMAMMVSGTTTATTMGRRFSRFSGRSSSSGNNNRRMRSNNNNIIVRGSSDADADARLQSAMAARVAAVSADPGAKAIVETLCELAEQEFGLAGVKFNEVMGKMDECYDFAPTFYASGKGTDGETKNEAGTNNGSCKTFYFAKMHGLSEGAALRLFCEHYQDVLDTPEGDSHANIRAFMKNGYAGLEFGGEALTPRGSGPKQNNDI